MDSKSKCPLITMILLSLLIFIAGGALLIAGFMLKFSTGILELEVTTLFNRVLRNNIPLGILIDANSYIMIIVGGLVMIVAIFGICGAWKHIKGCLWAFVTMIIVMIILQGVVLGIWVFIQQTTDNWFRGRMLKMLESYEGPEATDDVSVGWNKLFMAAECCGVDDQYASGSTKNDFSEIPAAWWANRNGDNLPASCCQGVSKDTISDYVGSALCTTPDPPINFYPMGCYNTIRYITDLYSLISVIVLAVIFFVEITAIVCACLMVKTNKVGHSSKRTGFEHPNQKPGGNDYPSQRSGLYEGLRPFLERPKQIRY